MVLDRRNGRWVVFVIAVSLAAIVWYVLPVSGADQSDFRQLTLGVVAGAIICFEALLPVRKYLRAWRIGKASTWMRAHVWLGLLCVPLVSLHARFSWGSALTTVLAVLLFLVVASGVFGLVMQYFLPRLMLEHVPGETIYSQIPHLCEMLLEDGDDLIRSACGWDAVPLAAPVVIPIAAANDDTNDRAAATASAAAAARMYEDSSDFSETSLFQVVGAVRQVGRFHGVSLQTQVQDSRIAGAALVREAYQEKIRPFLQHGPRSGDALSNARRARDFFDELRTRLSPDSHNVIAALEGWCSQRRDFHLQARMHRWLYGWSIVHVPLSVALVTLMFAHVWLAFKFR